MCGTQKVYSHMTVLWYDIYLTAIGLTPGGSSTHLHTNNTQNNTNKQYIEQHIMDTKQYIEYTIHNVVSNAVSYCL
jgi:hypothetical protein